MFLGYFLSDICISCGQCPCIRRENNSCWSVSSQIGFGQSRLLLHSALAMTSCNGRSFDPRAIILASVSCNRNPYNAWSLISDHLLHIRDFFSTHLHCTRNFKILNSGLLNVKIRALALLIRTFLETPVHPNYKHSLFHEQLYHYHILQEHSFPDPGLTPYYDKEFYNKISHYKAYIDGLRVKITVTRFRWGNLRFNHDRNLNQKSYSLNFS